MYREHFGLERKPFQIATDPDFLWLGEKHREALATLAYGVQGQKGFLVLTGEVGSGKTTLINALLQHLGRETVTGVISDPRMAPLDLLNAVASVFGLPTRYASKAMFLGDFRRFLELVNRAGQRVLLIIDEAQRLDNHLLEEIRLLSNIEWRTRKLINIFFVGQTEFLELLMREENRALKQRVALHYRLPFLSLDETAELIRHRLRQAGARKPIFSLEAIPPIQAFSQGAPRLINIACDHALLLAYVQGRSAVTADIVAECVESLMLPGEGSRLAAPEPEPAPSAAAGALPPPRPWPPVLPAPRRWGAREGLALAALACLAAAGGFYAADWRQGDSPRLLVSNEFVRVEPLGASLEAPAARGGSPPPPPALPGAAPLPAAPPPRLAAASGAPPPRTAAPPAAAPAPARLRAAAPLAAPPAAPGFLAAATPQPILPAAALGFAAPRQIPAAPLPDPAIEGEKRLLSFLAEYCQAYEGMDLERFCALFTPEAREQGVAFQELIPKYRENFARLEALDYRIALTDFRLPAGDEGLALTGDFVARYRLKTGGEWRESRGRIAMQLVEAGGNMKVRRLDYAKE